MNEPTEYSISRAADIASGTLEDETSKLRRILYNQTPQDGTFSQRIPGLHINRYSNREMNIMKTFFLPSLLIVAQGKKTVTLGKESYEVGSSQMLMFPVSLPIALQTTQASISKPFLSVGLELSPQKISELVLKVYPNGLPTIRQRSAVYLSYADSGIINAVIRLVECLKSPSDTNLLAPLVLEEILIRILRSKIGVMVAEMGFADSSIQRVGKAISWLRDNFKEQIKITDLAQLVHMSESSFHEHFKSVTSMSPLQYQKALRLHEAKNLMISQSMDAGTAGQLVGYSSDSQFSRDYNRFFGKPPKKDIASLRQQT